MRRRTFVIAAGAAVAPLGGCTGDSGPATDRTPTETPGGTPTDTPTEDGDGDTARDRYPDYDWGTLEGVDPVAADTVAAEDSTFDPLIAAVAPGTTVTFVNEDSFEHTVTMPTLDVDDRIDARESTTVTFDDTGTYDYVCTFHPPDMLGRIVVTEEPSAGSPTATPTPAETPDGGDGNGGYY